MIYRRIARRKNAFDRSYSVWFPRVLFVLRTCAKHFTMDKADKTDKSMKINDADLLLVCNDFLSCI